MPSMTDPADALESFQQALLDDQIVLRPAEVDPALFVLADEANGQPRLSYARLRGDTVIALVNAVLVDPIDGLPCFQLGCAVPESYRRQGLAKSTVRAAIAEMKNGFARANIEAFWIEAIVGTDNKASQSVAAATISTAAVPVTDSLSGQPALQYVCKITR